MTPWHPSGRSSPTSETIPQTIAVASSAFAHGEAIPQRYTCDDADVSPPLDIRNVSPQVKSLAIIVDDPDAPMGTYTHAMVWNIPPNTQRIEEGALDEAGITGKNSFRHTHYGGPCPPFGKHRYFFTVYGLDAELSLEPGSTLSELKKAMEGHIIEQGQLMGVYSRKH